VSLKVLDALCLSSRVVLIVEIPPDVQMRRLFFEKDLAADSNR
jgi:hypothetical protein